MIFRFNFITFRLHKHGNDINNINEEEISAEMKKIEEEYPGIWSYTDEDIEKLQKEVEIASKEKDMYENLLPRLR